MALEIRRFMPQPVIGLLADRRLYLTSDWAEMVEEGDPRAAFLLVAAGSILASQEVARLRLTMVDGKILRKLDAAPSAPTEERIKENGKHRKGK